MLDCRQVSAYIITLLILYQNDRHCSLSKETFLDSINLCHPGSISQPSPLYYVIVLNPGILGTVLSKYGSLPSPIIPRNDTQVLIIN